MFKRNPFQEKIKATVNDDKKHETNKLTENVPKDVPKDAPKEIPKEAPKEVPVRPSPAAVKTPSVNKILKGSKLIGDINVTCDLELSGDVEGNITSMQNSNILLQGACRGNITTKEGSVVIEGEVSGGNITAGKDVRISGKFNGGEVKAAGKVFINGEFNGTIEGNDVEIGENSKGKGEIFYKEYISISRGARVDVHISQSREALKEVKTPPKAKTADSEPVVEQAGEVKTG